jgi:O-antigen/teichoic acid export membrane protein
MPAEAATIKQVEEPQAARADSITRNTVFGLATQLTTAAFTAALTLFLVRALGPDDYGIFALATGIGTILVMISDYGLSGSSGRFIAERRHDSRDVAGVTWEAALLKMLIGVPVGVGLVLLADPIANAYNNPDLAWPLRATALVVVGQGMFLFLRHIFVSVGRVSYTWQVTLLESAFEFLASVTLVAASATATAASFGRGAGYLVGALIAGVLLMRFLGPKAMAERSSGHMRSMSGYAGAVFVVTVAYTLFEQIGILMVGAIEGTKAVAVYEAPTRLTVFLSYAGMAFALGVAPRLARGREGPNVDAFLRATRYLTIIQAALIPPLLAWSTPIVDLTLGPGYEESADVLRALTPYVFLSGIGTFVTVSVNYVGEARRRVPLAIASAVLVAALNLILLPAIGVVGAAVSMDIAFAVYSLGHIWICHRTMGVPLRPIAASFARCLLAAGAATLALAAFGTESLSVFDWVVGGLAGMAAFALGLFATREITLRELRGAWAEVRYRLRGARSG